jgi:hypothetical protein
VNADALLGCGDPVDVPAEASGHVEGAHNNHAWPVGDLRSFSAPAAQAAHQERVVLHQAGPHLPRSAAEAARDPGPARRRPAFASPGLAESCRWLVFPCFEPVGRDLGVPGPVDVAATDSEPLPGRAGAHSLTHDSASCSPAPTAACGSMSRWAQPTSFNAHPAPTGGRTGEHRNW